MTEGATRPTGVVTFMFTDIEGSTTRWERDATAMAAALAEHDRLLRHGIAAHHGYVFATTGDGFGAAFATPGDAAAAADTVQTALTEARATGQFDLHVRIGLATGQAEERDGDYFGPIVNRTARIGAAAHGDQVIAAATTVSALPTGVDVVDLGRHRLRDLLAPEHLYQLGGEHGEHPPLNSLDQHDHNLPTLQSALFGFEQAVADTAALLRDHRAVCLTGIGGIGKTRLALEVAASTLGDYDLTRLIDLSRLVDDDQAATAIASALQAEDASIDALVSRISTRRVLLLIDNCEHLLDPIAALAETVVLRCPNARILATSREPLGIDGERVRPVRSLSGEAAVSLFVDRATALQPTLIVDESYRAVVARLCERLDGIPLAIELAAGRSNHMHPDELERLLDDRFQLLAGGRRNALQRQQTLQATMDWSYRLLDGDEQRALQVAAVFRGGFTAESFSDVAALDLVPVLDLLRSLVDQSLVQVDASAAVTRYRLLETVRIYGYDRLVEVGDAASVRSRHAHHYLDQLRMIGIASLVRSELVENDPGDEPHPDLWNRIAALEWFEQNDDVANTALLASLITLSSIGLSFSDRQTRYLESDVVVDQLGDVEQAVYCLASILNANLHGRFDVQLRLCDVGLRTATGIVRVGLLLIGANAAAVFDPDRVESMISEALGIIDADDGDMVRLALARQIDPITIHGDLTEAREALTRLHAHGQPRPRGMTDLECMAELLFLDYLLTETGLEDRTAEWRDIVGNVAHRSRCVDALTALDRGDLAASAAALGDATQRLRQQPYPLAEHDIIICAAIRRLRSGDASRACELLATVPLLVRSPASYRLLLHARALVKAELSAGSIASIRERISEADHADIRRAELDGLAP